MEKVLAHPDSTAPEGAEYWLLRHGKAPHNQPDEVATFGGGQVDNELTEGGIKEVETLAAEIAAEGGVDLLICSRMKRSRQTAEIIARIVRAKTGREAPVVSISDLEEVDVGDFTGHTEGESRAMDAQAANAFYEGRIRDLNFPGGEDYAKLQQRVKSVKRQVKEMTLGHKRVAIVGHGIFNRVIMHNLYPDLEDVWRPTAYPHDKVYVIDLPNDIMAELLTRGS
ncbi:MAG: histidine phosphatase family protein [Patescibacteria group bacterium]|mgnify:CR=1 FL=1